MTNLDGHRTQTIVTKTSRVWGGAAPITAWPRGHLCRRFLGFFMLNISSLVSCIAVAAFAATHSRGGTRIIMYTAHHWFAFYALGTPSARHLNPIYVRSAECREMSNVLSAQRRRLQSSSGLPLSGGSEGQPQGDQNMATLPVLPIFVGLMIGA